MWRFVTGFSSLPPRSVWTPVLFGRPLSESLQIKESENATLTATKITADAIKKSSRAWEMEFPSFEVNLASSLVAMRRAEHSHILERAFNLHSRRFKHHVRYSRHQTELPSRLDSFPFLDVVGWNGALSAHRVSRSVPVRILEESDTSDRWTRLWLKEPMTASLNTGRLLRTEICI